MPRERKERDAKERGTMKDDGGSDFSVRSRKRKANVAVFLQDPDEQIAKIDRTVRGQCGSQPWDSDAVRADPCSSIPTPDKEEDEPVYANSTFDPHSLAPARASPLPVLNWANREEVWKIMLNKEKKYLRDQHFLQRHPLLQPKMRAILLDWLMEVCEVYKLHRETFYLAQDFFDRYMATQENIVKTLLQLIGISSLFIAAKLEEIYPPKLHQFAYVTDGACSGDEILTMELVIMKALKWHLSPLTIVSWLNVYMQVAYLNDVCEVLLPQYPQQIFTQIAEVGGHPAARARPRRGTCRPPTCHSGLFFSFSVAFRSLCPGCRLPRIFLWCPRCLRLVPFLVIRVDAEGVRYVCLTVSSQAGCVELSTLGLSLRLLSIAGYQWCDIEKCVKWMVPFAMVIRETGSSKLKHFRGVPAEDAHNIQTHINSLDLLVSALPA
uniref:Cyclin E1 n=1 Tax=Oryctolagus cuniculus TaxID=9986 RepID=A0A5F9CYL5_RABIT